MFNLENIGKWILVFGLALVVFGGLLWLIGRLKGFDNLPGTLRIEAGGITCIIPLLASIVLSILLTVVLNLIVRHFHR